MRCRQTLGDPGIGALHEHGELVATGARHQVRGRDVVQPRGDLHQQPVAEVVAERAVQVGEAVEVQGAQAEVGRGGGGEGAAQQLLAGRAVGQQRQRVLRGDLGHPPAQVFLLLAVDAVTERTGVPRGHLVEDGGKPPPGVDAEGERGGQALTQQRERGGQHVLGGMPRAGPLAGQAAAQELTTDRPGAQRPELLVAAGGGEPVEQAGEPLVQARVCVDGEPRPAPGEVRHGGGVGSRHVRDVAVGPEPVVGLRAVRAHLVQRRGRRSGAIRQAGGSHHAATSSSRRRPDLTWRRPDRLSVPPCPDATRRGTDSPGSVTARLLFVEPDSGEG